MATPPTEISDDLLVCVFSFLDVPALCAASQVCRIWHLIASDDLFWKPLYLGRFPIPVKQLALTNMAHVVQVVQTHIIGLCQWKPIYMAKIHTKIEQKFQNGLITQVEQCFRNDNFVELEDLFRKLQKLHNATNDNFIQNLRRFHYELAFQLEISLDMALRTDAVGCAALMLQIGFRTYIQAIHSRSSQLLLENLNLFLLKFSETGVSLPLQIKHSQRLSEIVSASNFQSADLVAAKTCLGEGANVDFVCNVVTKDTLLHQAVIHGNLNLIQLLIENGAKSEANATRRLPVDCVPPLRFPAGHFQKIKEIFLQRK